MLDRQTAPAFKTITRLDLAQAVTRSLRNGTPVHVINAGDLEVVRLEFIFPAGRWFEDIKGQSYFCTHMLREGTTTRKAADISAYIDKYGAFLDLSAELDYVTVGLYCLNKHFATLIPLMKDLLHNAIFPEEELQTLLSIKGQHIRVNNEKNNVVATQKFKEMIFGKDHPYGKYLKEDELNAIHRKDLARFYTDFFQRNYEIIVSGKVEEEHLLCLDQYFGDKIMHKARATQHHEASRPGDKQLHVQKPESLQSSIRMGKVLIQKDHPDYKEMQVVNEILGGYFGSRLMKNIREEKGYTYGIFSRMISLKHAGYFIIGADVKKEFANATINEIYKEIKALQDHPVSKNELQTVKNYMIGSFLSGINTPFDLADKFKSIYLLGLGYDHYQEYIATINTVTEETIMEMAKRYLNEDDFTEVIVG